MLDWKITKSMKCPKVSIGKVEMEKEMATMPGWMNDKQESKQPGEISITSDIQMTPPYGRK